MRTLLVALLCLPILAEAKPFDQQATVVKLLSNGRAMCSAVVIAPDKLVSAAHCLVYGEADAVETPHGVYPIQSGKMNWPASDFMVLTAPGVNCPCAETTPFVVIPGETAVAVGFPGVDDGAQRVSIGKIIGVDRVDSHWRNLDPDELMGQWRALFHTARTLPGMSGGGVFIESNGRWLLIAVNSLAAWIVGEAGAAPLEL